MSAASDSSGRPFSIYQVDAMKRPPFPLSRNSRKEGDGRFGLIDLFNSECGRRTKPRRQRETQDNEISQYIEFICSTGLTHSYRGATKSSHPGIVGKARGSLYSDRSRHLGRDF